jgi:hypothetical protein
MNNLHTTLIQTALLARRGGPLQLKYLTKCGESLPHRGFYKTVQYIDSDKLGKFTILIYLTSKSATGFVVRLEATGEVPSLLLIDRHIEDFEDFENTIDQSWSLAVTKASHRRQLGK